MRKFAVVLLIAVSSACASFQPHQVKVSQLLLTTVAQGLPAIEETRPAHGKSLLPYFSGLVKVAHTHGVQVFADETLELFNLWGWYSPGKHSIHLNTTLDDNGAVAVLAHELAHMLLDPDLPKPDDDIAAQAVSYVVVARLGLDTAEETLNYYRDYGTADVVKKALMRHGKEIDRVAEQILTEMK